MALSLMRTCGQVTRPNSVQCQAKKGKVNDRGKVSSRPGPPSPKETKKRAEEMKKLAREQEAAAVTASPAASTPASTPAATTSSTSLQPPAAASPAPPQPTPPPAANVVREAPKSPMVETPQVVSDRIFSRMIACAGIPVLVGIGLLSVIFVLKKQGGDDFPMWPAYLSQGFTLLGGLLGISYGALSASWDPSREGSIIGWTEFRANLPIFMNKK